MTKEIIKAIEKDDLSKLTVYKDNKLIEATYSLTLIEQHLLLTCIAQINPKNSLSMNDEFRVSAENYMKLFDVERNTAIKNIKTALFKLGERWVTIKDSDGEERKTRWLWEKSIYEDGTVVGLSFTPKVIEYLTHLDSFTRYKLNLISAMTSPNAIRLYEIFVQKTAMGITKIDIEVEWLRKQFCLTESYKSFGDFNKKILIESIEQINKHSNLTIAKYTSETGTETFGKPLKRGRSIYGFTYVVRYKKGQEHKTLKQAGLEVSQNKPQPELVPVESVISELDQAPLGIQATQLPVIAPKEQPPQVYKHYPKTNYGKNAVLSDTDRRLATVAEDGMAGMTNLSEYLF